MPEIMLRRNERGDLLCYVPKKDSEVVVREVEFDQDDHWGGTLSLANGEKMHLEPMMARPRLPVTLRVRKLL
ncbi:MAG: putative nitrogen fixation protein NifT [Magnetococcales bacterium]|nr:putative nitrogen fixation protein NifT [Magnetococcales bacterium]MBF0439563.1 putative nitrogen fixation protein NifT [Magnetococcales bacterium]